MILTILIIMMVIRIWKNKMKMKVVQEVVGVQSLRMMTWVMMMTMTQVGRCVVQP